MGVGAGPWNGRPGLNFNRDRIGSGKPVAEAAALPHVERVPEGSCQVNLRPRRLISRVKSMVQSLRTTAVRS